MGVRSGLQIKAKAIAPGFAGIFGSLLVEDSLILGTESVGAAGALSTTVPVSLVTSAGSDQAQTFPDRF